LEDEKREAELEEFNKQRDLEIAAEREAYIAANAERLAAESALAEARAAATPPAQKFGLEHNEPLSTEPVPNLGLPPNREPL